MSRFAVRRVTPAEAGKLRDLRLEALRLHPESFSRDLGRERTIPLAAWRENIGHSCWFACLVEDAWAGIANFSRDLSSRKTAHWGSLGAMYVRAAFRGQGAGDALVEAVLSEAKARVKFVELWVSAENAPAIALYERHGFRQYGRKPRALFVGGRYYDEIEMMKDVAAP